MFPAPAPSVPEFARPASPSCGAWPVVPASVANQVAAPPESEADPGVERVRVAQEQVQDVGRRQHVIVERRLADRDGRRRGRRVRYSELDIRRGRQRAAGQAAVAGLDIVVDVVLLLGRRAGPDDQERDSERQRAVVGPVAAGALENLIELVRGLEAEPGGIKRRLNRFVLTLTVPAAT